MWMLFYIAMSNKNSEVRFEQQNFSNDVPVPGNNENREDRSEEQNFSNNVPDPDNDENSEDRSEEQNFSNKVAVSGSDENTIGIKSKEKSKSQVQLTAVPSSSLTNKNLVSYTTFNSDRNSSTESFRSYLHSCYQSAFNLAHKYEKPKENWKTFIINIFKCNPRRMFFHTFPVLRWLLKYNWRTYFIFDILAGFTVAVMHITQGMAYSMLGNVDPVVGIHMAFYPVMVYAVFGTSRHISIGTFAVVCLMSGSAVDKYSNARLLHNGTIVETGKPPFYTQVDITSAVCLVTSMFLILMYILRLGVVAHLFSETMVNAFTCACAFKVVTMQIDDILGVDVPRRNGLFSIPLELYDCALKVPKSNIATLIISLTVIIVMVTYNEFIKGLLAKKTKLPFPIELTMLIGGTCASHFMSLNAKYNVDVIGEIPRGLPPITIPNMSLLSLVVVDGLLIAITSYAVSVSMALIYASKGSYKIDGNQELLALGLSDLVGTFTYCMPVSASLSRTHIQYSIGGKTQITSLVSCGILVFVLLWIGSFLESLPKCVLASIIVVSMKSLLVQCLLLPHFWKLCKWDGITWIVTFFTTAVIRIDIGLGVGLSFATFSIFYRSQHAYTCTLGEVTDTEVYLDMNCYKSMYRNVGFNPKEHLDEHHSTNFKYIILDCTAITYIDPSGAQQLRRIARETMLSNVSFLIAGCSVPVYETLKKCDALQKNEIPFQIFFSVNSAVLYAKEAKEIPEIKVFHYAGVINFSTKIFFMKQMYRNVGFNPKEHLDEHHSTNFKYIILDCTAITYIDPSGAQQLRRIARETMLSNVSFLIAGCSVPVYETLKKCDGLQKNEIPFQIFFSVNSAVLYAKEVLGRQKKSDVHFED